MRTSFIEGLEHEEEMPKHASELLTAMSHDLRTPLTSLIGYLDIIDLGKCHSPEQVQKYVHSGKQKAYQIKEMTDKLFEYFLVYSENDKPVEKERLDAATLFTQLWSESAMSLETEGFHVDMRAEESTCEVLANVPLLRRVFDNLVSNVRLPHGGAQRHRRRAARRKLRHRNRVLQEDHGKPRRFLRNRKAG